MAILKIARMGHPVLMGIAQPVEDPKDPRIHGLIADMVETMADAPGIGLAAPQVHVPLRIVVFRVPGERCEDKKDVPLTVLVNPVVEIVGDEVEEGWEGCLSLPELTGRVPRPTHIRYRAQAWTARPSSARPRAITPASCSMNATIWTAFCTPCA